MNTTNEFKTELQSDEELTRILKNIISQEYKHNINDWIYYAKPNEKKGLYILSKVVKHKGQRMFKTQLTKTKQEQNDVNKLTLEEAFNRYQKKKNLSSYAEFYGGNLDEKYKYNNILKFKDFQNLNYAEVINKEIHAYIQAWISIEKTEQYKEYALDFLRSFLSTVRSNRKFVTNNFEQFQNFKEKDKFTSHAPYLITRATGMKYNERVPTLEEMRARFNLDTKELPAQQSSSNYNETLKNMEEIKTKKLELMAGSKNFLKGIFQGKTTSSYQDVYRGLPVKYPLTLKNDHSSSMVKGVVPDAYSMNRIKSALEISDNLKNTVKTIMFSEDYNNYSKYR